MGDLRSGICPDCGKAHGTLDDCRDYVLAPDPAAPVEYWLSIMFRSNEHPWCNDHYNHYPKYVSLDEAIDWARGMADGMGDAYTITLFGDGRVIDYASR